MKASEKRIIIRSAIALTILTIGGYYLVKYIRKSKANESNGDVQLPPIDTNNPSSENSGSSNPSSSDSNNSSSPFKTKEEIQAFQDWLDKYYPSWLNGGTLNKGKGYGNYGVSTTKAYQKYGATYQKYLNTQNATTANADDISLIKQFGRGGYATESSLTKLPSAYVKAWANSIRARIKGERTGGYFIFEGRLYDDYFGQKYANFNPINKAVTLQSQTDDVNFFILPKSKSQAEKVSGKFNLGIVKDIKFNPDEQIMFVYIPRTNKDYERTYKWVSVKRIIPA